jgi:hypothetical protein
MGISAAPASAPYLGLVLQGKREVAQLASMQYLNGTDVGHSNGSAALYSYIWQLRGSVCTVRMGIGAPFPSAAVACNASLADSKVTRCSSGAVHVVWVR